MSKLAIIGAGGLGKELALWISNLNDVEFLGFYDDATSQSGSHAILGTVDDLNRNRDINQVIIGIGDPNIKKAVFSRIRRPDMDYPCMTHPSVNDFANQNQIGVGTMITAGVNMTCGIELGDHVLINLNATIGHDVSIGSFSSIMPGANISGNVSIGEETLIGSGAVILQGITIGNNVKVGAGAVVTKDIPDNKTVVGVPARIIK